MPTRSKRLGAASAAAVAAAVLASCSPGPGRFDPAECGRSRILRTDVVVLSDGGRLTCVQGADTSKLKDIGVVSGLGSETLVGIDYRSPFIDSTGASNQVGPEGVLYGLGSGGGIFTIDATTAVATKRSQLSVALSGANFDIDFNPTVDRLRVLSDSGQNLRVNVDTGVAIVDGTLNYGGATATGISAGAYTNVDADPATATTLYTLDTAADQLAIQSPPNDGAQVAIAPLGVDAAAPAGFDLYSTVRPNASGVLTTVDLAGHAVLSVGGRPGLYEVTPFSGRLRSLGSLRAGAVDLAIPLAQ